MNETPPDKSKPSSAGDTLAVGSLSYTRSGLIKVCFWLFVGAFAWALKSRAAQPITQLLLSDFGATDKYSGVLIGSFPAVAIAFVFPLLGYMSDHHRGARGRRIPFVILTIPLFVLSLVGLTISPWLGSFLDHSLDWRLPGFESFAVACLTLFWMLFAFADILGGAIFGALVNDVIPHRIIGRFFGIVRALSLLAGFGFNYYFLGIAETTYVSILLGVAVIAAAGIGVMCIKVREGTYPEPPPEPKAWPEIQAGAKTYLQDCFTSPFYRLLFIAWALGTTAWNPINYYIVFIASGYVTMSHYGNLLLVTFTVSFILAYPLGVLADWFHPLRLGLVALALYFLATLWGGFLATTPVNFDIAFLLHGLLSGAYLTVTASLLQRLLPPLKYLQFASAAGVLGCLCNVAIVPIAAFIFNATNHASGAIFLLSSAQGGAAFVVTFFVYRAFLARGGDKYYTAPINE